MRFKRIYIILVTILSVGFAFTAYAATDYRLKEAAGRMGFTQNANFSDVTSIIALAIQLTLSLLAIIFFGMMCYGGFRWLTAQGEEEKIGKAQTAIKAAIIGMVVVVASYGLTSFIFKVMNVSSSSNAVVNCTTAADNTTCAYNRVCKAKKCIDKCEYDYPSTGVCMDQTACELTGGTVTKNICPGGNSTVCCH